MNIKTFCFVSLGIFMVLFLGGCGESTFENDTNGDTSNAFTIFRTEDGLADNSVTDITVDYIRNGVWFATRNGISFYSKADLILYTYGVEHTGIPDMKVTAITVDNSGTVWAGTETGVGFLSLQDSVWSNISYMDSRHVTDIESTSDLSVWFGTRNGLSVISYGGCAYPQIIGCSVYFYRIYDFTGYLIRQI